MQLIAIFIFNAIIIVCSAEKESEGKRVRQGRRGKRNKTADLLKIVLFVSTTGTKGTGGVGGKSFDEGWCCSGWVHDNSWAEDFPPLSIIFNGLRDRQVTETNSDGSGKKITRVWQWWVYEEGSPRWQWRLLNATQHNTTQEWLLRRHRQDNIVTIVSRTYLHRNCCSTFPEMQNCTISASWRGLSPPREAPLTGQKPCVVSAFCCNSGFVFSPTGCYCTSSSHEALCDFSFLSVSTKSLKQKRIWATRREELTVKSKLLKTSASHKVHLHNQDTSVNRLSIIFTLTMLPNWKLKKKKTIFWWPKASYIV